MQPSAWHVNRERASPPASEDGWPSALRGVTIGSMLPTDQCDQDPRGNRRVTLIGYWEDHRRPDDHPTRAWPSVRDFVDEHWDHAQRDLVARYLEHGISVPWHFAGSPYCRFCGASNGSLEKTDYVYLWPEGLAHYVREHAVRLPDSVVRHIVRMSRLRPGDLGWDWWRTATLDS